MSGYGGPGGDIVDQGDTGRPARLARFLWPDRPRRSRRPCWPGRPGRAGRRPGQAGPSDQPAIQVEILSPGAGASATSTASATSSAADGWSAPGGWSAAGHWGPAEHWVTAGGQDAAGGGRPESGGGPGPGDPGAPPEPGPGRPARFRPSRGALALAGGGLAAGLLAGYAVGVASPSRGPASATPASPSASSPFSPAVPAVPPAPGGTAYHSSLHVRYPGGGSADGASAAAALQQTSGTCSAQNGNDLEIGLQVTNESDSPVTLSRVMPVTPEGGLTEINWNWGPCGAISSPVATTGEEIPPGASDWFTVTFRVTATCPHALPVQFFMTYTVDGQRAVQQLPGFPDLGAVPYSGC
ncbi:MAG TPA: hypothetical protein VH478_01775 [Trebonia sp.]|nr:hypothetical protein [Trebonia sp.]